MQVLHEPGLSLTTRRTGAVLRGMSPAEAIRLTGGAKATDNASTQTPLPKKTRSSSSSASTSTSSAPAATQAAPTPSSSTTGNPSAGTAQQLLDYLLGGGA
jgi:hypothetical protein